MDAADGGFVAGVEWLFGVLLLDVRSSSITFLVVVDIVTELARGCVK